jgi:hypothetical protein
MDAKEAGPVKLERTNSPSMVVTENAFKYGSVTADWTPEEERRLVSVLPCPCLLQFAC